MFCPDIMHCRCVSVTLILLCNKGYECDNLSAVFPPIDGIPRALASKVHNAPCGVSCMGRRLSLGFVSCTPKIWSASFEANFDSSNKCSREAQAHSSASLQILYPSTMLWQLMVRRIALIRSHYPVYDYLTSP